MATHSRFLFGEPREQRSLLDYSPQGRKELDMTEVMSTHTHSCDLASYSVALHFIFLLDKVEMIILPSLLV